MIISFLGRWYVEIPNRQQRLRAEMKREQFLYYGQATCTLVRKYTHDNTSRFQR